MRCPPWPAPRRFSQKSSRIAKDVTARLAGVLPANRGFLGVRSSPEMSQASAGTERRSCPPSSSRLSRDARRKLLRVEPLNRVVDLKDVTDFPSEAFEKMSQSGTPASFGRGESLESKVQPRCHEKGRSISQLRRPDSSKDVTNPHRLSGLRPVLSGFLDVNKCHCSLACLKHRRERSISGLSAPRERSIRPPLKGTASRSAMCLPCCNR